MEKTDDVYRYFKKMGFLDEEISKICEKNKYLERVIAEDVNARIVYFRALGMSDEEIKEITLIEPNILVYSLNRMKKIQKQYIDNGMDIEEYKNMLLENIHILSLE